MQGGSGLSSSTVSLGRQSGRELTGPGRKAWITPPGGSALRAKLHSNGALNWGDLHIPLGRPTVEGGEDGGSTRPVSGRKRCLPRLSHLLMHFREKMEPEAVADDRPAPPGTNRPALSVREKEEASSAARRSQRPGKA